MAERASIRLVFPAAALVIAAVKEALAQEQNTTIAEIEAIPTEPEAFDDPNQLEGMGMVRSDSENGLVMIWDDQKSDMFDRTKDALYEAGFAYDEFDQGDGGIQYDRCIRFARPEMPGHKVVHQTTELGTVVPVAEVMALLTAESDQARAQMRLPAAVIYERAPLSKYL